MREAPRRGEGRADTHGQEEREHGRRLAVLILLLGQRCRLHGGNRSPEAGPSTGVANAGPLAAELGEAVVFGFRLWSFHATVLLPRSPVPQRLQGEGPPGLATAAAQGSGVLCGINYQTLRSPKWQQKLRSPRAEGQVGKKTPRLPSSASFFGCFSHLGEAALHPLAIALQRPSKIEG